MVNDPLHGERCVHARGFRIMAPSRPRHFSPPDLHDGACRDTRADRFNFRQMPFSQILIKTTRPGEPHFQESRVWCATGEIKNVRG
jgi:hypothetical protein